MPPLSSLQLKLEQVTAERDAALKRAEAAGGRLAALRANLESLKNWAEGGEQKVWSRIVSDDCRDMLAALSDTAQGWVSPEVARRAIRDFAERVNRRAETEMQRTGILEGAHHRAIQAELAALAAPKGGD